MKIRNWGQPRGKVKKGQRGKNASVVKRFDSREEEVSKKGHNSKRASAYTGIKFTINLRREREKKDN